MQKADAAAELLFISQPALSRSMQKLEEDLGVQIFSRKKNKLELNENGKLTYELAKKLLDDFDEYTDRIRAFDRASRTISVGSCAPAPLWKLIPALTNKFPDKTISSEMKDFDSLNNGLSNGGYQIIILNYALQDDNVISQKLCTEKLYLCLPKTHPLAVKKDGIRFAEIGKITMLLYGKIGFWYDIHTTNMPETRFIIQNDRQDFVDLVKESMLPSFVTDMSIKENRVPDHKLAIPVLDESASQTFYINYLKKNKSLFQKLL